MVSFRAPHTFRKFQCAFSGSQDPSSRVVCIQKRDRQSVSGAAVGMSNEADKPDTFSEMFHSNLTTIQQWLKQLKK